MTKVFLRSLLAVVFLIVRQYAYAQTSTSASTGDYASDLGFLNGVIKTNGFTRDICIEQFPEMRTTLDAAYSTWRERYKQFLQEIAMRWNLLMIQDAKDNNTSMAANAEYMNGEYQKLRAGLKTMYSKEGPEKFRSVCDSYPVRLLGEPGNIENHYPEHVETIRKVKLY
jgi:hypothetical protein